VLTKIERRKKRQKLRGESVCRIIEMNVMYSILLSRLVHPPQKMFRGGGALGALHCFYLMCR